MKLNFTIELPCKNHKNCYNLELDDQNPVVHYNLNDNQTEINQLNAQTQNHQSISYDKFGKISIKEEITKTIIQRRKSQGEEIDIEDIDSYKQFLKEVNKEYNALVDKYNLLVDSNSEMRKQLQSGQVQNITGQNFSESEQFKIMKQKFESLEIERKEMRQKLELEFEEMSEKRMKSMKEEIEDLRREMKSREDKMEIIKKHQSTIEVEKAKRDDEVNQLRLQLEERYDHFEELNKYINDLLKEKKNRTYEIELKTRRVAELELDLKKAEFGNYEKITINEKERIYVNNQPYNGYKEREEIKGRSQNADNENPEIQKELDNAYKNIKVLQETIEDLQNELENKKKEIITVTKEINTKETDTITKKDELKTKETQVIKLRQKERLKEWKQILDQSQEHAKSMKNWLEHFLEEKIFDNLDLEVKEQTGIGYYEPITIYLDKSKKYHKQMTLLINESQENALKMKELKQELKNTKGKGDISDLMDILQENKKTTGYFVELLKIAKKEKFANLQNYEVDSEDASLYIEAIYKYFHQHEDYYKEIRDNINDKNKELKRLNEFEKSVKTGKNKESSYEDFLNILEKNKTMNKTLCKILNEIYDEEIYKYKEKEKPNNATSSLDQINEQFTYSKKLMKNIGQSCQELREEKNNLINKIKESKEKPQQVDLKELKDVFNECQGLQSYSKKVLSAMDPEIIEKKNSVTITGDNPLLYKEGILRSLNSMKDDLNRINALSDDQKMEIERLKKQEIKKSSMKTNQNQLNDLRFVLNKNKKLLETVKECYAKLIEDDSHYKEIKQPNEEEVESFIQVIGETIRQSKDRLNELNEQIRQQGQELVRLKIFEKEIREGKNKDYVTKDFKEIFEKSKKNLKEEFQILENSKNQSGIWNSTIFNEEENPEEYLKAVNQNLDNWHNYNRELNDVMQNLQSENSQLKKYVDDVKSGKNKEGVAEDFVNICEEAKQLNNDLGNVYEKISENKKIKFEIDYNEKNPETILEAIYQYNKNSKKLIQEISEQTGKKNKQLKDLKEFEAKIQKGEDKTAGLSDYQRFCQESQDVNNDLNKLLQLVDDTKRDQQQRIVDRDNPDELIEEISKRNQNSKYAIIELNEKVKILKKDLEKLNDFKKDVNTGKDKSAFKGDMETLYEQSRGQNDKLRAYLQKQNKELQTRRQLESREPDELLECTKNLNKDNSGMIGAIEELDNEKEKELEELQKYKKDVQSGKDKSNVKDDLLKMYKKNLQNAKRIKKNFHLLEDQEPEEHKFFFEDRDDSSPDDYIRYIDEMNNFQKNYIEKLKLRIEDLLKQLRELRNAKKDNQQQLEVLETEKIQISQMNVKLKQQHQESSVDYKVLQSVLQDTVEMRRAANMIQAILLKSEVKDEFEYNEEETNAKLLVEYIEDNCRVLKNKVVDIKPMLKNSNSTDPMLLLEILNQIEQYKINFLQMFEDIVDDEIEDTSNVNMKEARSPEKILDFIYKNIEFLSQKIEDFQDEVEEKINVVIAAKNKILTEKEKIQYMVDDLTKETNKKTSLIGKL